VVVHLHESLADLEDGASQIFDQIVDVVGRASGAACDERRWRGPDVATAALLATRHRASRPVFERVLPMLRRTRASILLFWRS
jgi:hypothetical protein